MQKTYGPWPDPKQWLLPRSHSSQCGCEKTNNVSEASTTEKIKTNCVAEDEETIKMVFNASTTPEPVMHLDTDSGQAIENNPSEKSDQDSIPGSEFDSKEGSLPASARKEQLRPNHVTNLADSNLKLRHHNMQNVCRHILLQR